MKRHEYLRRAFKAYSEGKVSEKAYDAMLENADVFCDDDDDAEYGLPDTYAEVEYDEFDTYESVYGARWDDMNYLHYMER